MRPSPLRTIVSSQALMSGLTDTINAEIIYDTVLFPQINQNYYSSHTEINVFYISLAMSVIIIQKYLTNKQFVHKWKNMRSYQLSKKQTRAIFVFLFTFFVRNIETAS